MHPMERGNEMKLQKLIDKQCKVFAEIQKISDCEKEIYETFKEENATFRTVIIALDAHRRDLVDEAYGLAEEIREERNRVNSTEKTET